MPPKPVGPGTRLIVAGALLATVLVATGASVAVRGYADGRAAEVGDIAGEAHRSAELIQRFLLGQLRTLDAAAGAPVVRSGDSAAITQHLEALDPESLGFSGGMGWVDADGVLRVQVGSPSDAPPPGQREWVEAFDAGRRRYVGAAEQPAGEGPPLLPLAVSVGGDLDGGSDAFGGAVVGWLRLDEGTTPLSPFRDPGQQGFLIDRAGHLIASDSPLSTLRDVSGQVPASAGDGEDAVEVAEVMTGADGLSGGNRLVARAAVPLCRCTVVVERAMADTIGERRQELVVTIVTLLIAAGSGLAAAIVVGRRANAEASREWRARQMAARLQDLNARLPLARTTDAVTELLTAEVTQALGAVRASVLTLPRAHGRTEDPADVARALTPLEKEALAAQDLVVLGRDRQRGDDVSAAALPLVVGRRTVGLLELRWSSPVPLTDGDADYLRSVARQGAVALERAARQMNDQRQRARAEALQRALGVVARASTRAEVLEAVRAECIPALDGVGGGILGTDVLATDDVELIRRAEGRDPLGPTQQAALAEAAAAPQGFAGDEVRAGLDVHHEDLVDPRLWPLARQAADAHVGMLLSLEELRQESPDAAGALVRGGAERLGLWPVDGGGATHGVLVVLLPDPDDERDETRTRLAALATQLGRALDRAARSDAEREIARTLQRSLLGVEPPSVPDVALQTFYSAASEAMEVGGDWFDAVAVDDDDMRVLIGDLVGHGLIAAAAMGRMRSAARALAAHNLPDALMDRLDEIAATDADCFMSTAVAVRVQPRTGLLTCAVAGHPPPLLLDPVDGPRLLDTGSGPPLGLGVGQRPAAQQIPLSQGTGLLLYTDGLVERRGEALDDGLRRLLETARRLGDPQSPGWLDRLVAEVTGGDGQDDVACVLLTAAPSHATQPSSSAAEE